MNDERISSSSSMGSILPSSVCRLSDIEEPHFLRVLLDERAARLDLVAHQHRKDLIGRLDVFHRHELEGARHGVHGGVPELVGVHLAEPLEALQLDALLGELHDLHAELLVALRLGLAIAEVQHERRFADHLADAQVDALERLELAARDGRIRDAQVRGQTGATFDQARVGDALFLVDVEDIDDVALVDVLLERLEERFEGRQLGFDHGAVLEPVDELAAPLALELLDPALVLAEELEEALIPGLAEGEAGVCVVDADLLEAAAQQDLLEQALLMDVGLLVPLFEAIERRLRDVDVAGLDQRPHVPEEEREDERADVRAVHVGVGHDDDLVVAGLRDVELVAEAGADRADHGEDLVVGEHLVDARLLDVDDLAAQRQDRLEAAVARLLGRAAGRVALDEVDLAERRVFDGAVGELAGQSAARQA